jgi:hypothetical protein
MDKMVMSKVVAAPLTKMGDTTYWRINSGASIIGTSTGSRYHIHEHTSWFLEEFVARVG